MTLSYLCHGARENTANEMMMGLSINTNDWSQYEMHIGYRNLLASINVSLYYLFIKKCINYSFLIQGNK